MTTGIVSRVFKGDAFRRPLCEVLTDPCRCKQGKGVGKSGGTVRHAIKWPLARTLPDPAAEACGPKPVLSHQMFSALDCAIQNIFRLAIAIETKETKYGTGAPADDIQLSVCRDKFIGKQSCRHMGVRKQIIVIKKPRYHCEAVNNRAQAGGSTNAQRTCHPRRIAAFQILSEIRNTGQAKFRRGPAARDNRMRSKK